MKKSTKKALKQSSEPNQKLRWALGTLVMVLPIMTLVFTNASVPVQLGDPNMNKFALQNIGTGFLLAFYAVTFILIALQKSVYYPFINKKDRSNMDERQATVRMRVFERSYRALAIFIVLSLWLTDTSDHRMRLFLGLTFVCTYFAMPVVVALRQKDS